MQDDAFHELMRTVDEKTPPAAGVDVMPFDFAIETGAEVRRSYNMQGKLVELVVSPEDAHDLIERHDAERWGLAYRDDRSTMTPVPAGANWGEL